MDSVWILQDRVDGRYRLRGRRSSCESVNDAGVMEAKLSTPGHYVVYFRRGQ